MLDQDQVLPNLIAGRAAATPDRVAIQCVDGTAMTLRAAPSENMRWAAAYRRAGVKAGDNVASMVVHSFASYSVWLGLGWLKAVEVPANTGYRGNMLAYLIENSEARLLVISARVLRPVGRGGAPGRPTWRRWWYSMLEARRLCRSCRSASCGMRSSCVTSNRSSGLEPPTYRDVSSVIYTSGTTGPSKGVLVSWAEPARSRTACCRMTSSRRRRRLLQRVPGLPRGRQGGDLLPPSSTGPGWSSGSRSA